MTKTKHTRKHTKKHTTRKNYNYSLETTFHGLHKWQEAKFEKLGWMILAKSKGHMDKVMAYINSLHRLRQSIIQKINHIHDKDKKEDLKIMLNNVNILCEHADKDLM